MALLDREQARSALAASNSFAARVLDALDACAGPAPPALQPLVVVPMPPPASRVPAPQQEQVPAAHAAPPGRSPGGARKPAAPRKRRAVGAAGAARSIRFAQGGPDSHAGMLPPGIASFQELLGSQLDASMLGDLINADDERLLALGQRVASALPPLDQWEARLRTAHAFTMRHPQVHRECCADLMRFAPQAMGRGEHSGGLGGGSGAGGGLLGFGNEDSRFPLDDIISTFGADPTAQQVRCRDASGFVGCEHVYARADHVFGVCRSLLRWLRTRPLAAAMASALTWDMRTRRWAAGAMCRARRRPAGFLPPMLLHRSRLRLRRHRRRKLCPRRRRRRRRCRHRHRHPLSCRRSPLPGAHALRLPLRWQRRRPTPTPRSSGMRPRRQPPQPQRRQQHRRLRPRRSCCRSCLSCRRCRRCRRCRSAWTSAPSYQP